MIDEAAARLEKLTRLREEGIDPYPATSERTHAIEKVLALFEDLEKEKKNIALVGRVRSIRTHGELTFAHIEDGSGKMQIALRVETVGADAYKNFVDRMDVGDFIEARGELFQTKRGERTLDVKEWKLLSKALLPLPEKWHGLVDTETRYRQRYLDLVANEETRGIFRARTAIIRAIRSFLDERGYLEVETPILQSVAGGAAARPFVTHHNALDIDLYLRIAPELHLKRLLVGGFERVYELARCFRNEGVDHLHYPEFTMLEYYQAYATYEDLMEMIEELLPRLAEAAGKDPEAIAYEGETISLRGPYPRLSFRDALIQYAKIDLDDYPDQKSLAKKAASVGAPVHEGDSHGTLIDNLYKKFVRPHILQPTFLIDHPLVLSPLAKKKSDAPNYVERFQLVLARGSELINGFSELNDPVDQETRFREQEEAREAGDEEAQREDNDYVLAMRHGMPPAAGLGMGIERLTMLLTGTHSIKEVILFPTLRPKSEGEKGI